jgi:hypothetical protein
VIGGRFLHDTKYKSEFVELARRRYTPVQ